MPHIFISYAREDVETAKRLAAVFRARGWAVWWDTRLRAGEVWDEVIERALEQACCVVVLWSAVSVKKHWVKVEADEGRERGILAPALIESVRPPLAFRPIQAEDLIGWAGDADHLGLLRLIEAVERFVAPAAATPTPHAPPPADPAPVGVDPATLPDFAVFKDVDEPWCPEMVILPAGSFLMGSPETEVGRDDNEGPQHRVTISRRFAMGCTPVTFEAYDRFCAATKRAMPFPGLRGRGRGARPVIDVSWEDAQAYCAWLSDLTHQTYRLPSEAEWEYACRAGTTTRYSFGDEITAKDANFGDGTAGPLTAVGAYPANPWGLRDMHGNVFEWCLDGPRDYGPEALTDPLGPTNAASAERVLRGGSWAAGARAARSAWRSTNVRSDRTPIIGFRCARRDLDIALVGRLKRR